jgi:hypothetical protein
MSQTEAVRAAAVALTYEIEATMRMLDSLPSEPPNESQRAQLKQVLDFRVAQINGAHAVLNQRIDTTIAGILETAPRTWSHNPGPAAVRDALEDGRR